MSPGLGLDGGLCLEIGIPRSIPEDVQTLLDVVLAEHVLERRVHPALVGDLRVVRAALVDDLQRHAVLDGLAHRVLVDVLAEDLLGLVDRRARVADLGGVGDAPLSRLAPSSLYCERWASSVMTRMLGLAFSSGKVSVRSASRNLWIIAITRSEASAPEQFLEPLDAVGQLHREADALTGLGQLLFQLGAIGDEDDLPVRELRVTVHLPNHEHHGERLAGALGVPDDAAALAGVTAFDQPLHRQLHRAELLVSGRLSWIVWPLSFVENSVKVRIRSSRLSRSSMPATETLLVVGAA